jgi:hypothetical protein
MREVVKDGRQVSTWESSDRYGRLIPTQVEMMELRQHLTVNQDSLFSHLLPKVKIVSYITLTLRYDAVSSMTVTGMAAVKCKPIVTSDY